MMGDGDWEAYYAKRKPVTREEFEQLSLRMDTIEQQYSAIMQGIKNVNNSSIAELNRRLSGRI
jgi:hypothetical protein